MHITHSQNASQCSHSPLPCSPSTSLDILQQIIQIVIVPAAAAAAIDHNLTLLLLLLLGDGAQQLLELVLGDLLAQLARAGEHDEAVLNVCGARLLDEADAAEAVGGFGGEDLGEDRGALVGCGGEGVW